MGSAKLEDGLGSQANALDLHSISEILDNQRLCLISETYS